MCWNYCVNILMCEMTTMLKEELLDIANEIIKTKSEKQNIEVKAANGGCPKRLYDTLSSFLIKMVVASLCLV